MIPELTEDQIQRALQGIKIPPQPQILIDLQKEQLRPEPDLRRIAELISRDVGLAGAMLKIVNSAAYSVRFEVTSVQQAVTILGINSVINIVNGLSLKNQLSGHLIAEMNRFWDTANDIALMSATIARQVGYKKPDLAYLLGLFHNCGIPLLLMRFDHYLDVLERAYGQNSQRIVDVENQELSTNHAVAGYYTAKSWKLPKVLCDVVAEHHSPLRYFNPDMTGESEDRTLLAILKLAEHICGNYKMLGNQEVDYEWEAIADEVLAYLGLGEYDVDILHDQYIDLGLGSTTV